MNNAAQQYRQKTDTSTMTILKSEDAIYPMLYLYHAGMREACARFDMINEEFKFRYQRTPIHNVESRIKKPESIHEKLKRKNLPFTIESIKQNIHDIAGIRILKYKPGCNTENIDISNELLDCSNIIAVVDKRIQAMSELLKPIK